MLNSGGFLSATGQAACGIKESGCCKEKWNNERKKGNIIKLLTDKVSKMNAGYEMSVKKKKKDEGGCNNRDLT